MLFTVTSSQPIIGLVGLPSANCQDIPLWGSALV